MKPATPQESYETALGRSDRDIVERLERARREGRIRIVEESKKPDFLVGGSWPSRTPGAMRASCSRCSDFVGLTPGSGADMRERYPDVPIICYPCATKIEPEVA